MQRRVTLGLGALRAAGIGALALLLWNYSTARPDAGAGSRLVLLDASLSMTAHGGRWREAADTARALAGGGGVIWRFGARVTGFDTLPPADGASRLAPALAAAAARGGEVAVVTDGAISDRADIPLDLLRRARIVLLPRAPLFDAFVADVSGPTRIGAGDTLRLRVSYGTAGIKAGDWAGKGPGKGEERKATLAVSISGRRVLSRPILLPDSGIVSTDLTLPPSPAAHGSFGGSSPSGGWQTLDVRLEGVPDSEPRDDGRLFVLEVSPQPSVVLLAAPPDWESRFLARTVADVARVPVRAFVAPEPGAGRWRDAATLEERAPGDVARAVAGARLVIAAGDPAVLARFAPKGAELLWPTTRRQDGDWYVQPPGPSPLAGPLSGLAWDSLPPATTLAELAPDSAATVGLTARLARRGAPRPALVLSERDGRRRAVIAAGGLYRWAFRGGASAEAYRALVAAVVDWLLAEGEGVGVGRGERFRPLTHQVPNGMAVVWRWTGGGTPRDAAVSLDAGEGPRVDTLRFDASGRAELWLPPGAYRYAAVGATERGLVAVDTNSDEWRPGPTVLVAQTGEPGARLVSVPARDRWWLFALAIAAFAAEWAWRRREGLP